MNANIVENSPTIEKNGGNMDPINSLYVYGVFDDSTKTANYSTYAQAMSTAGFNTVVLSTFHINPEGNLYNGQPGLMAGGRFNTEGKQYAELPEIFAQIKQASGGVTKLLYSVGNWAGTTDDLNAIANVMQNYPDPSDAGNPLYINIQGLRDQLYIDGIDCDFEPHDGITYDQMLPILVYFTELCYYAGVEVTYCPFTEQDTWFQALAACYAKLGQQPVIYLNLQTYGVGADPAAWITAIENYGEPLGISDPSAFVIPGYSCDGEGCDSCASSICNALTGARGENSNIRGAFVWQLGDALTCDLDATLQGWAGAVNNALNGQSCGEVGATEPEYNQ